MEGKVVAVSVSPSHTVAKVPPPTVRLLAGLGVEGDMHAGEKARHLYHVRRDPSQPNFCQVHLIDDDLRAAGFELALGQMGENVTTRGLDLLSLPVGTRPHIGPSSVLELTGLRTPCRKLDGIDKGLMAATREKAGRVTRFKAGVLAVVAAGGVFRPGDAITAELPPRPHEPLKPL